MQRAGNREINFLTCFVDQIRDIVNAAIGDGEDGGKAVRIDGGKFIAKRLEGSRACIIVWSIAANLDDAGLQVVKGQIGRASCRERV